VSSKQDVPGLVAIASQAVISGAFSTTRQAIQLGFLPRMEVVCTSMREAGKIYLPRANWALMVAVANAGTVPQALLHNLEPDIPQALLLCRLHGLEVEESNPSYFLSREVVVPTRGEGMAHWRERLFAAMARNAGSAAEFLHLPDNAILELGTRVQI